jgi:16S rRNA (uracil1498-N3)-methyltransferase
MPHRETQSVAKFDFAAQRLFVEAPLAAGAAVALERGQANYLISVLRLKTGDEILVFNGVDGEWRARLVVEGRKAASLTAIDMVRAQPTPPDLAYLFAPLKQARLDYMIQKAVEMGAGIIAPVVTERTQASRLNPARLRANAVEAAEQCGILALPQILPEQPLAAALAGLAADTHLIFCDEEAPEADPVAALAAVRAEARRAALLIGPEGGFSPRERAVILAREKVVRLSLGPRILRADTAAVAALALVQAVLGDWR